VSAGRYGGWVHVCTGAEEEEGERLASAQIKLTPMAMTASQNRGESTSGGGGFTAKYSMAHRSWAACGAGPAPMKQGAIRGPPKNT